MIKSMCDAGMEWNGMLDGTPKASESLEATRVFGDVRLKAPPHKNNQTKADTFKPMSDGERRRTLRNA